MFSVESLATIRSLVVSPRRKWYDGVSCPGVRRATSRRPDVGVEQIRISRGCKLRSTRIRPIYVDTIVYMRMIG